MGAGAMGLPIASTLVFPVGERSMLKVAVWFEPTSPICSPFAKTVTVLAVRLPTATGKSLGNTWHPASSTATASPAANRERRVFIYQDPAILVEAVVLDSTH